MKTDIQIAQEAPITHIKEIAQRLNISAEDLEYYGKHKAKLPLNLIDTSSTQKSKLILVTAINPTPAGEGKTTISIGLHDGLCKLGKKSVAVLREPSLGPVFGMKGGAAGGGYSQVIPMEDINLHFTGDFNAIEKANNLLSAVIDNHLHFPDLSLNINPKTITWKRVMDMNDRSLRQIIIGVGGNQNGVIREDGFNITPASEIMAILCLSNSLDDLKQRLEKIFIGFTFEGHPVYARDLKVVDAMVVLLKDAIKPNLVQTLEGNPVILHGGPFASIAQGTNSILATKMGMSLADYVVTEAGFGADLGAEKFFHIKCQTAKIQPDAVVLVVTIRALRHHGGATKDEYNTPNANLVAKGLENLEKHIQNMQLFGYTPLVVINYFPDDTEQEIKLVSDCAAKYQAKVVIAKGFSEGGEGMREAAKHLVDLIDHSNPILQPIYHLDDTLETKIEKIAKNIYGATHVTYSTKAKNQIAKWQPLGIHQLPVCMAKTPKSFSDNDHLIGCPKDFSITVRDLEWANGAGFVIPILGDIMRMPGLQKKPNAENIKINTKGVISGLS